MPNIYYDLICSDKVLDKIFSYQNSLRRWEREENVFAIVGKIKNVTKIDFSAGAEYGGESVYISDDDIYLASGEMIDLLKLGGK